MSELNPMLIAQGLTYYIVLLFSISVHESAHACAAFKMGDDTAKRLGRVSLNPLDHIDLIGTVVIPLAQIFWGGIPLMGWAKPTPYDPSNFRRDRSLAHGHIFVAFAGPASNLILAVIFAIPLIVVLRMASHPRHDDPLLLILQTGVFMNVALAVFNLIPLPPLDGSKLASWGLPRSLGESYDRIFEPYGPWLLLILFVSGAFNYVISPVLYLVGLLIQTLAY